MSHNLNDAQRKAVLHQDGPLLIVAGAGAGKTRVIVHRIGNLIRSGVAPENILAVTFTNKAAREMRERVEAFLSNDPTYGPAAPLGAPRGPFVATFHALGVRILREHGKHIGIPRRFTIFDRNDSLRTIKEAMRKVGIDPKQYEPRMLLSVISKQKGGAVSLEEYEGQAGSDYVARIAAEVWREYDAAQKHDGAIDFDDLLVKTYELLTHNEAVRTHYKERFRYIHIDEYQDTNRVQHLIVNILAENHKNICVVGDLDQNIYSWRGANVRNMLSFEKTYPNATTVFLEENYRSTQVILRASNMVIEKNRNRVPKTLFTNGALGEFITLMPAGNEVEEAYTIAARVKTLIARGTPPKEIALLYRTNFQSRILEEAFLAEEIPYQVLGTRFFERREVKDMLAFIRLALRGESATDLSRVINVPPRGIGKVTLLKIIEGRTLTGAIGERVRSFRATVEDIATAIRTQKPSEAILRVAKLSGIEKALSEGTEDDKERLLNIRELAVLARRHDTMPPEEGLPAGVADIEKLLEDAALQTDQDELKEEKNAVRLMTVHASKGLEFETVFVTGLEDGLFPHKRLDEKDDPEEERRLFYVALTRARKKVFLSYAHTRTIFGSTNVNVPSEFIGDIDKSLLEMDSPVDSAMKTIFLD